VKGAGFVRQNPAAGASATAPRTVREVGLEYVDQIVDCSPGQRKRYRAPIGLLTTVEVRGKTGMYQPNSCVAEVAWSLPKDRACRLYRHRFRRSSSNRDATASTSLMKETVRLAVGL